MTVYKNGYDITVAYDQCDEPVASVFVCIFGPPYYCPAQAITGCDSVVTAAHSTVGHEGSEKLLPPFLTATRPFNKWDVVLNEQ